MSRVFYAFRQLGLNKFHPNHGIIRHMCNHNNELSKPSATATGPDLLMANLKHASSTHAVLNLVSLHSKIMNNKHIMQALRSLFSLQKAGSSEISTQQILSDPNFNKLCRQLKFQAGAIELNETIDALKIVSYVGVPSNSTIVQVLLQLIRHNINHLNLGQIMFMDFLLNHFKSTPLVDALKIALPIVFELNVSTKLDCENENILSDSLYYAVSHHLNDDTIGMIVKQLMKIDKLFEMKVAKSIIWSICELKPNDVLEPLMKKALNALVIHFDELSYIDIEATISKLTSRFTLHRSKYCYDEVFFDSCANYIIDNDLGFKKATYFVGKCAKVQYLNTSILDYIMRKAYENPENILNAPIYDIYSLVGAVALTEYRPPYWDDIKKLLEVTNCLQNYDKRDLIWVKFAATLSLLQIYRVDVLNKCFNEDYLRQLFKRRFYSDFENLCIVWQSIKLYKPELSCLLPVKYSPERLVLKSMYEFEFPLEGALQKGLGSAKYVLTDFYTKLGQRLDHIILFRKGGYPVAIQNDTEDVKFIEDLDISPDSQVVIVQCLEPFHYTINKRRLKYSTIFSMKILEDKGYLVVPVCWEVWQSLEEFEKIPYLMQAIKEKMRDAGLSISEGTL